MTARDTRVELLKAHVFSPRDLHVRRVESIRLSLDGLEVQSECLVEVRGQFGDHSLLQKRKHQSEIDFQKTTKVCGRFEIGKQTHAADQLKGRNESSVSIKMVLRRHLPFQSQCLKALSR